MRRLVGGVLLLTGCVLRTEQPNLEGKDVRVVFLHTSDWHSRLLPYDMIVGQTDEDLTLEQANAPFGGAARIATLIRRERARESRILHVDSGDVFQGAPIFNVFQGEAEMRVLSAVGLDAAVIGNHEFDLGGQNFVEKARAFARFPLLAANYLLQDPNASGASQLATVASPMTIVNVGGLRVAIIGMGNISSLTSIYNGGNSLGITPLESAQVLQDWVDFARPLADMVVVVSHVGPNTDEALIQQTEGIDIVFGGHLHIVLSPPKVIYDCALGSEARRRRNCEPRPVLLVHSGAFMKFLGKLTAILRQAAPGSQNWDVVAWDYELTPVDSTIPEDAEILRLLEPYAFELRRMINLVQIVGHAPAQLSRFGTGSGDSELGNLVATAMQTRRQVETDFALTNSLGIRANLDAGPITVEEMFNVFPFENTIVSMFLSGVEVQELFDFVTDRSSGRGCNSQAQIAGATVVMVCDGKQCDDGEPCAKDITIGGSGLACDADSDCTGGEICTLAAHPVETSRRLCGRLISPLAVYELAANDFIARGGSGFEVLARNTSQVNLGVPLRQAVIDYMGSQPACGEGLADDVATPLYEAGRRAAEGEEIDLATLIADYEETAPDYFGCTMQLAEFAEGECAGLGGDDLQKCAGIQDIRSALLCLQLPCIRMQADGRIERVFPQ